jgi:cephalosporin hydroxylase
MMNDLKRLVKRTAKTLAPRLAAELDERWWLRKKIAELLRKMPDCHGPADYLATLQTVNAFAADQKRSEILRLLEMVRDLRPQRLCEIGSAEGGTLFLFAQTCDPTTHLISVDICYSAARRRWFPRFARPGQTITCVEADSHDPATVRRLRELLSGEKLDFLFIDGDHSYNGAAQDFEMYAPLVHSGGLIGFHDIVPDFRTRFGAPTKSDVGEVPRFWAELKKRYPGCEELIDDPDQDGYGIGVLHWDGELRESLLSR